MTASKQAAGASESRALRFPKATATAPAQSGAQYVQAGCVEGSAAVLSALSSLYAVFQYDVTHKKRCIS